MIHYITVRSGLREKFLFGSCQRPDWKNYETKQKIQSIKLHEKTFYNMPLFACPESIQFLKLSKCAVTVK